MKGEDKRFRGKREKRYRMKKKGQKKKTGEWREEKGSWDEIFCLVAFCV